MSTPWLTADQVAVRLSVRDPQTIYRMYREGVFGDKAVMAGSHLRVNPDYFASPSEIVRDAHLSRLCDDLIRTAAAIKDLLAERPAPGSRVAQSPSMGVRRLRAAPHTTGAEAPIA